MVSRGIKRRTFQLFRFDQPYLKKYRLIAGVDEAGRGPLAGPVVAAAVILPSQCKLPFLNDSKLLTADQRATLFHLVQGIALSIGVGIIESGEIDRINILQATFSAMRLALSRLHREPEHVLVDGYAIPSGPVSQTGLIGGDGRSAHIAAASIIAKVTRDTIMDTWDKKFPAYGFKRHKGYGTPEHLSALKRFGPSPIHRQSFAPVRQTAITPTH